MLTTIFAHRGASHFAPENTMAAFELAYELGAEGIETDVHLTKDHVPVLIHDDHLKRTTNGRGYIKDYTYDELIQFDAGSWFSHEFTGERIISLEDFLQWIKPKNLLLNIELKNNKFQYQHVEDIVYETINHHQLQHRTVISTFNKNSVERMQKFANIETALLVSKGPKNLISVAKELGAQAVHIKYPLLKNKLMKQASQENIAVRVFTVNKKAHMKHCFSQACEGVFTDIPNLALKEREPYA